MQHIILLHGAIGAKDQLLPLANLLKDDLIVHTLNFQGHGGTSMPANFTMQDFAHELLDVMAAMPPDTIVDGVHVFGYSMGGYIAMLAAKQEPELFKSITTLATKYYWDDAAAQREVQMLNPEKIEEKVPAFATTLEQRHQPNDWKEVLAKTAVMLTAMGADNPLKLEDYAGIKTPCLLLLGDRDKMVTLEETVLVYRNLPNAQLGVLPNTPHAIEQVDAEKLAYQLLEFIL